MAQLLSTIRDSIAMQNSIKGRFLGLGFDKRQIYRLLGGPSDFVKQVEDITTTAATSASPHGHTAIYTSGSTQIGLYSLQSPIPGIFKSMSLVSTSTGTMQFQLTDATLITSTGATGSTMINLLGKGAAILLWGVTTALWQEIGYRSSAAAVVSFTTST